MGLLEDAARDAHRDGAGRAAMAEFFERYNYARWGEGSQSYRASGVVKVVDAKDVTSWGRPPANAPASHHQVLDEMLPRLRAARPTDIGLVLIAPDGSGYEPVESSPILHGRPRWSERRERDRLEQRRRERDDRVHRDAVRASRHEFWRGTISDLHGDDYTVSARVWLAEDWYFFTGGRHALSWGTPEEFARAAVSRLQAIGLM